METGALFSHQPNGTEHPYREETLEGGEDQMTLEDWMRDHRTLSQEEVDRRTRQHDIEDLKPAERRSYTTGSMPKVTVER